MMLKIKEQTIALTIFSTDRNSSQLCKFVEDFQKSGTAWVEGITVALEDKKRQKYYLKRRFAANPNEVHSTVQVMENQLWALGETRLIESALQSNKIPYVRSQIKTGLSYLNKRNSKFPLEEGDIDVRYTPRSFRRKREDFE